MEIVVTSGTPDKQRSGCLIVGVHESRRLSPAAKTIDAASNKALSRLIRSGDMDGRSGQSCLLHNVPGIAAERVLLIGCGKERELGDAQFRKAAVTAATALAQTGATQAVTWLAELNVKNRDIHWRAGQIVLAAREAAYRFEELKSRKDTNHRTLTKLVLGVTDRRDVKSAEAAIRTSQAIANGMQLAKDLANLPANICNPVYLASQARSLQKKFSSVKVRVLGPVEMKKHGMGSLLSVAQGSEQPPRFIIFEYNKGKRGDKPVCLVGKGVTFDTGGISIKPSANMDEMKYDMCGGASVFGAVSAVAELRLPINLVGIVPAVENMPSGKATRPGDIYTSLSGQTIEVLNTDAEGRLILCDALTYCERYEPAAVIDIATLTGACVIALGKHASGLLSNHEPLAQQLLDAGQTIGDRTWQLPLWEDYQQQLESPFADMANVGGREAGTITAACFLSRFTKKFHWAHMDIAGIAWLSGKEKGATGRPVPLLVQYLLDRSGN